MKLLFINGFLLRESVIILATRRSALDYQQTGARSMRLSVVGFYHLRWLKSA